MLRSTNFMIVSSLVFICAFAFASEPIKVSSTVYPFFSQPNIIPEFGNGVVNDLTVQAYRAVDKEIQIDFVPMARITWSVIHGNYDAALGTINWFARENKDNLVEAVNLVAANIVFFYKNDRFPGGISYEKLSELKNYKVGSIRGSSTLPLLEEAGITTDLVAELKQNFIKLDLGRIDLTVAVDLTGLNMLKKLFPDSANTFSMVKKPILSIMTSMTFPKEKSGPIQEFKKGLGIITENGIFYEIIERYYGKDYNFKKILPRDLYDKMKKY